MFKKNFITEKDAINALRRVEDQFLKKEHVIYLAVRRRRNSKFNIKSLFSEYEYYVEVGYKRLINGRIANTLDIEEARKPISVPFSNNYKRIKSYLFSNKNITSVVNISEEFILPKVNKINSNRQEIIELQSGVAIRNDSACGTLGGIFQINDNDISEQYFGISNWHVLKYGLNNEKDVYFPSQNCDDYTDENICGKVCWSACDQNREVAFVHFDKSYFDNVKKETKCNYSLSGKINSSNYDDDVIKCGQASNCYSNSNEECQSHKVYAKHVSIKVNSPLYTKSKFNKSQVIFRNQILIERNSDDGDSGSLIVSKKNKDVLGLIFATSADNRFSVANDINYIFHDSLKLNDCEQKYFIVKGKKIFINKIKLKTIF